MDLVRVARIADLTEAQVIASALEAADIEVLVQSGQVAMVDPLLQTAMAGFNIMVPEAQAREAVAFIREHRAANPDLAALNEAEAEEVDEDGETWAQGRERRRHTWVRWLVVGVFVAPGLVALMVMGAIIVVQMIAGVLGG